MQVNWFIDALEQLPGSAVLILAEAFARFCILRAEFPGQNFSKFEVLGF